jgi:hypothetical protein
MMSPTCTPAFAACSYLIRKDGGGFIWRLLIKAAVKTPAPKSPMIPVRHFSLKNLYSRAAAASSDIALKLQLFVRKLIERSEDSLFHRRTSMTLRASM